MRVSEISWVGIGTDDFESTVAFFSDVIGLPLLQRDDENDVAIFKLESGQLFEVFGPRGRDERLHTRPVIAFEVEDINAARNEMEALGIEFATDIRTGLGQAWCYFVGPDDCYYEIKQSNMREL